MSVRPPQTPPPDDSPPAEQQLFERLGRVTGSGERGASWLARAFAPFFTGLRVPPGDWVQDAELALREQAVPRARAMLYAIVLTFALLLGWAAVASVDEVTRGEGRVIPSRQLQVIQSVDGGVVEAVFVREGQTVEPGELLVRIDPTRFVANFQEGSVRAAGLRAKIERLEALIGDRPYQPETVSGPADGLAPVIEQELRFYRESRQGLLERLSIAHEQRAQRQREIDETRARLEQAERTYDMSGRELEVTRPLLASGAVSEMDILRLERDRSNADGERQQARARLRLVEAGVQEADARIREVELAARNQWHAELTDALAELNSLDRNVTGLADRVKYAEIRSPVRGTVQRVFFNTLGGVVQPGHAVAEIVPADDQLLVEARIAPADIAFLRPGLPAVVKFHAYDFSVYGGMAARLEHISADTITDERDNTYYLVRAATEDAAFAQGLSIIPGMTVQLDILTGKKTVLAYLLKPILRATGNALSER